MTDVSKIKGVRDIGMSSGKIVIGSISCRTPLNISGKKKKKKGEKK